MQIPSTMRAGHVGAILALAMVLSLGACGGGEEAPPSPPPAAQPATPASAPVATDETGGESMVVQPSVVDTLSVDELLERADQAVKESQLFVPAGESAFEMYLRVLEQEPMQVRAKNALMDLFPYAVLYVEQRTSAGDLAESERVLGMMEEADENAPAVPRLQRGVAQLRDRVAAEAQRAADRAAAQAEAQAQAAAQAQAQAQAAQAAAASAPAAPAPVSEAPAPTPAPAAAPVVAAPPPAPTPVAPAPPPTTPSQVQSATPPSVVSQVQPRYPPVALRRRVEGSVEVAFTIMPDGSVSNVRVVSARPANTFDREVINAMERWRFTPPGRQVESRRVFDFKLP
ncbi:energy transducer TonB [Denitratimonas tolerans]|uniref:Protein TonB n=1 Tax=Denitratimonas tolerans TaxID=1338420 RepID=A0AAW9R7F1_9GAMM